jgi:NAD(P)-dependent dehydrogenase (short-subunit alcohol dehydrogenase family)
MAQNTKNNVLIVGGSSGIGLASAKLSLSHLPGANVIISSSNKDKLEKAVEEIKTSSASEGHIVDYVVADVSNIDTQHDVVDKLLEQSVQRFGGKIDHIVCDAKSTSHSEN